MDGLRTLEKGTHIIGVGMDVAQEAILVIDRVEDAKEAWKGQEYVCYRLQGGISFAYRIPVTNLFAEFRQVHPSEMAKIPWITCRFCTEDEVDEAEERKRLYLGIWKRARWSGWAIPWFTHETLLAIRKDWHERFKEDVQKHGLAKMEDWELRLLYDELAGWCYWNSNLQQFEKLEQGMAEVDGVMTRVWEAGLGLTWTDWTDEELAERREEDS